MAVVSTVTVNLTAETAKFENGLKKARKRSAGFGKAVAAAMRGATIATAAFTTGLTLLTRRSLETVDAQRKAARTLGTTQRVYAGLSLAAEVSGLSIQSFEKALKRQQKSIIDANDGLQTQARAFERLGLSAKELSALPIEDQFKTITTALNNVENATLKVAIASDLYGAKNADLINILELGADGIDSFINKVDELGVALTEGQTAAIEEANDSVTVLGKAFAGLGNQLAAQFAPAITAAAESITSFVATVTRNIETISINVQRLIGFQVQLNNLSLAGLQQEYRTAQNELFKINEGIAETKKLLAQVDSDSLVARGLNLLLGPAQEEAKALEARLADIIERQKEILNPGVVAPAPEVEGLGPTSGGGVDKEAQRLQRLADEYARFRQGQLANAQALARAVETPMETLEARMIELRAELQNNPFVDPDIIQRNTQAAVEAYLASLETMEEETKDVFANLNEFQVEAARNTQDIFAEFLFDPFREGLDGMLKNFVDMLRRMVAQLVASKLLTSFLSLFPGSAAAGAYLTGGGGATSLGVPAATGGNRSGGTPLLVGERGPEIFTPGATGAIRPLGAVSVQQENNFGGGDSLNAATLIPILEENNKRVKAEILDAFDRGSFA